MAPERFLSTAEQKENITKQQEKLKEHRVKKAEDRLNFLLKQSDIFKHFGIDSTKTDDRPNRKAKAPIGGAKRMSEKDGDKEMMEEVRCSLYIYIYAPAQAQRIRTRVRIRISTHVLRARARIRIHTYAYPSRHPSPSHPHSYATPTPLLRHSYARPKTPWCSWPSLHASHPLRPRARCAPTSWRA